MLPPLTLLELIDQKRSSLPDDLVLFWYRVVDNRDAYAKSIIDACLTPDHLVVPWVLREDKIFQNANSIQVDIGRILHLCRNLIERQSERATAIKSVAIVVLSKNEFQLALGSSPAAIPDWFPVASSSEISVPIVDLTRSRALPVNCHQSEVSDICSALFGLEKALVERLAATFAAKGQNATMGLFDMVKGKEDTTFDQLLQVASKNLGSSNPAGFRPSVRDQRAIVARLASLYGQSPPNSVGANGKFLCRALGVEDSGATKSDLAFQAVLFQPQNEISSAASRFGANLIIVTHCSLRFITAAAHADAYPLFPENLLREFSIELRFVMREMTALLNSQRKN